METGTHVENCCNPYAFVRCKGPNLALGRRIRPLPDSRRLSEGQETEIEEPGKRPVTAGFVESPGGVSPPGAPKTVHEPLDSHGSRCSAVAMA
jgi:hypothetical protein